VVIPELLVHKAVVIAPYTYRARSEELDILREAKTHLHRARQSGEVHVMQGSGVKMLCASCFTIYNNGWIVGSTQYWVNKQYMVPDLQRYNVPTLKWYDIPKTHTRCFCTRKNRAQCVGDKHLVGIDDVPVKSKLVALLELPPELRIGSEVVDLCALYLTGSRRNYMVA